MAPRVPQYDISQVPSGEGNSFRHSEFVTPDDLGAAKYKQVSKLGDSFFKLGKGLAALDSMESKVQKTRARDVLFQYKNRGRAQMGSYLSLKQRDAIDNYEDHEKALQQLRTDAVSEMKDNAEGIDYLTASLDPYISSQLDASRRHHDEQHAVWDKQTISSMVTDNIEDAVANRTNPKELNVIENDLRTNTYSLYRKEGQDDKSIAQKQDQMVHSMYVAALNATPSEGKKVFYEKYKDKLLPIERPKIKKDVDDITRDVDVMVKSKEILAGFNNLKDMIKEIDKIKDPKIRKQVRSEVEHGMKIRNAALDGITREEFNSLYKLAEDDPVNFFVNYQDRYVLLPGEGKYSKEKIRSVVRRGLEEAAGIGVETDPALYAKLMLMPASELEKQDLGELKLSKAHREFFTKIVRDQTRPTELATPYNLANASISKIRDFEPEEDEKGELRRQFYGAFQERLDLLPPEKQTDVNAINDIINGLLAPVDEGFFDLFEGNLFAFQVLSMPEEDQAKLMESNIPESLRELNPLWEYNPKDRIKRWHVYDSGGTIRKVYNVNGTLVKIQRLEGNKYVGRFKSQ